MSSTTIRDKRSQHRPSFKIILVQPQIEIGGNMFHLKHIGGESGHYELYYGNQFLCSADTLGEAWNELLSIHDELV